MRFHSLHNMKKVNITEKHIEAVADKTITAIISLLGNCQYHVQGKITGRLRNRFKTFVFTPTFPVMFFTFSVGDVEKIDITESGIVLTMNHPEGKPKHRRKKKKSPPVVAAEPDAAIDLNKEISVVTT